MDTGFDPAWIDTIEPTEVYKHDARSRVWRIDAPDGRAFVIKRFEFDPVGQRLRLIFGQHPGQRERRHGRWIQRLGLPVPPIVGAGTRLAGRGVVLWIATPYIGASLHGLFFHGQLKDQARRERVLDAAARLTSDLIRHRLYNRDHKASNILIGPDERAWLIDVGAVRPYFSGRSERTMVEKLVETLALAGASQADRTRLFQAIRFRRSDPDTLCPRP